MVAIRLAICCYGNWMGWNDGTMLPGADTDLHEANCGMWEREGNGMISGNAIRHFLGGEVMGTLTCVGLWWARVSPSIRHGFG